MTEPITHELLDDPSGRINHGFFSRLGGVSDGIYRSLNCGYGSNDEAEAVRENRARAIGTLGLPLGALCTGYQVHSAKALVVTEPWHREAAPRIDAMASATPGIALSILTADCVPVLLADRQAGVIGAAHAGWRGALDGVLDAAVATMRQLGAQLTDIRAVFGPCIGASSYEVGPEFPAPFLDRNDADRDLFVPAQKTGHFLFDLPGYVSRRLARIGITEIAGTGEDTCADADRFFSYRRSCHRGEPDYGRNISIVALGR